MGLAKILVKNYGLLKRVLTTIPAISGELEEKGSRVKILGYGMVSSRTIWTRWKSNSVMTKLRKRSSILEMKIVGLIDAFGGSALAAKT